MDETTLTITEDQIILLHSDFYGKPPYPMVERYPVFIDSETSIKYIILGSSTLFYFDTEKQCWIDVRSKTRVSYTFIPYTQELFLLLDFMQKQYYELIEEAEKKIDDLHKYEHWYKP